MSRFGGRERHYGMRRFVTATGSVAGPKSKVAEGEMLRAITRTVLLVHAASSLMERVEQVSASSATSPC